MREMTRNEWKLSDEEAVEILRNGKYGVLATADAAGQPYGVPLDYAVINDVLYVHGLNKGHKLDNIAENNRVCFTVVGSAEWVPSAMTTHYDSVVLFGNAVVVDEDEMVTVMREMVRKFFPEKMDQADGAIEHYRSSCAVVRIETTHISGKRRF